MRISAISYQTNPIFTSKENNKTNKLKNLAGATAIAIAAAAPMSETEAQIIPYPYVPNFIYPTYTTTADAVNTPKCFTVGDITTNSNSDKSLREIFNEIDTNGDGVISAKEVVDTERTNWNEENIYPFTSTQAKNVQKRFSALSKAYNKGNSNPKTINYSEYKEIMSDYEESNDVNFVPIYTYPYYYTLPPIHYHRPYRPHIHRPPVHRTPPPHRPDHHRH